MHFSLAGTVTAPNSAPLTVYSWEGFSDNVGSPVTAYTTIPTLAAGVTLYSDSSLTSYYFNTVTDTFVYDNHVYPDAGDNQTIKGEYVKLNNSWQVATYCLSNAWFASYYTSQTYFDGGPVYETWYEDPDFQIVWQDSVSFYYDPFNTGVTTKLVQIDNPTNNAIESDCAV